MQAKNNENITTFCRINDKNKRTSPIRTSNNSITVGNKEYKVDFMLNKKSQSDVFEIFKECISTNVESGYNCTVFAYGQTGSGKTYTIQGEMNNEGLVLRTLRFLHTKYKNLKISFLEIYNEELVDLSQMDSTQLNLREDKSGCVLVDGINLLDSASFAESESFYLNGIVNRKTSSTSCNEKSSRSHSIFTVYLEQEIDLISDKVRIKTSKLTFVDLAGSERLKEVENEKANSTKIFKETTTINKSLMNLGIVVNCLEQRAARHVPYRDSKLTFLLKDSLGGNSKLCIIGNISLCNQPDTTNTLQFLERIKLITNNPTVNYASGTNPREKIALLEKENSLLRKELNAIKANFSSKETLQYKIRKLTRDLAELDRSFRTVKNGFYTLTDQYFNNDAHFLKMDANLSKICDLFAMALDSSFKEVHESLPRK